MTTSPVRDQLRECAEAQTVAAQVPLVNEPLGGHEADVVAGVFILCPWVSQTYNDIFHGTCRLGDFVFVELLEYIKNTHFISFRLHKLGNSYL